MKRHVNFHPILFSILSFSILFILFRCVFPSSPRLAFYSFPTLFAFISSPLWMRGMCKHSELSPKIIHTAFREGTKERTSHIVRIMHYRSYQKVIIRFCTDNIPWPFVLENGLSHRHYGQGLYSVCVLKISLQGLFNSTHELFHYSPL